MRTFVLLAAAVLWTAGVVSGVLEPSALGQTCADSARWTSLDPGPTERSSHAMAYDAARGRVVMFGGNDPAGVSAETWEYDGTTWTRRTLTASPPARWGHQMVYNSARGRIVLFGGWSAGAAGGAGGIGPDGPLADTWEYDGAAWVERMTQTRPQARNGHAMAYDSARGRVVLFGGFAGPSGVGNAGILSDTWVYDGVDWMRQTTASGPAARIGHAMAFDAARGVVVLSGGYDNNDRLTDTWEYNGSAWAMRTSISGLGGRGHLSMVYDARRARIVAFGIHADDWWTIGGDTVWEYDGSVWTRVQTPARPARRFLQAMAYDAERGRVVLFGGIGDPQYVELRDTWEYDGANWTQRPAPATPLAPHLHAMAFDEARGRMVVFGGSNITRVLGDTWEHDGVAWRAVTGSDPAGLPPARYGHAMAYDAARRRVVLFGGDHLGAEPNDTWEFDGVAWTRVATAQAPPARTWHGMTFDAARGRIVLFGGSTPYGRAGGPLADTWEFDGTTWTPVLTPQSPPPRDVQVMAYDAIRQRVVLFMGEDIAHGDEQTREYDGATWTRRHPTGGPIGARVERVMAYDPARGRVVLIVGRGEDGRGCDVWEYDGLAWIRRDVGPAPPSRSLHAVAYDSARGRMMLFGGYLSSTDLVLSDTWTLGPGPLRIERAPTGRVVGPVAGVGRYTDLSVVADGVPPLTFRWRRNGVDLVDSANLSGTGASMLQIRAVGPGDVGVYTCVVTDACGGSAASAPASVTTCRADFNADGTRGVPDLFAYINAWLAGDPRSDVDADGTRGVGDIFVFLSAWFAGC